MHFNPHHPRGWRLPSSKCYLVVQRFQSTPPSRVATLTGQRQIQCQPFQSTPPSRVATALVPLLIFSITISIHTTLAGGDSGSLCPEGFLFISIHTTLAGGDWVFSEDFVPGEIFQSTPPSRVATISSNSFDMSSSISIHTTLAGGDVFELRCCVRRIHFNPHHPRGWRQ